MQGQEAFQDGGRRRKISRRRADFSRHCSANGICWDRTIIAKITVFLKHHLSGQAASRQTILSARAAIRQIQAAGTAFQNDAAPLVPDRCGTVAQSAARFLFVDLRIPFI
ncbi:hypothetical protein [Paracoccus fistulariae]|uniref:Uncharacterized protein n=1 Tax=Paracoccus fistulariae TaxID=658446 RepID=A0ABY7SKE9_9RHOB|nr:hypothetical protein [Paracoccus fistulariae]MDB6181442.1 hypothetical protein [Paracoccus fistulariae]WCR07483.1 hypothetical protein JHX87_01105 [Paracoccus fistulariae]